MSSINEEGNNVNLITIGNNHSMIKENKVEFTNYEVFLDEDISDPSNYRELISTLFNAGEGDSFTFYLNTLGGSLSSTMAIVEAMKNTNAHVTGVLVGDTHSGGSIIAMHCHDLVVLDSAEMMIHTASGGSIGTVGNVRAQAEFSARRLDRIIEQAYYGFLDEEEIAKVKLGVELWFDAEEIRERATRRFELVSDTQDESQVDPEPPKKKKKKKK